MPGLHECQELRQLCGSMYVLCEDTLADRHLQPEDHDSCLAMASLVPLT